MDADLVGVDAGRGLLTISAATPDDLSETTGSH
jgi:hypothetical protein